MQTKILHKGILAFKEHSSLFVIGTGAGIIFLCNILFEKILTPDDYGEYAILVTYIGTIYNIGYLGLDQVFLRLSTYKDRLILTNKLLLGLIILTGSVVSVGASYYFTYQVLNVSVAFYKILIISAAIISSMFVYNLYRIQWKFLLAQVAANLWKFGLSILALAFLILKYSSLETFFNAITIICGLALIIYAIVFYKTKFKMLQNQDKSLVYKFWLSFAISIVAIMTLTYFDKYYIKETFGPAVFGRYFYLASIFLFPFHLLQNYTGFKKLVYFKDHFSWSELKTQSATIIIQSTGLGVLVVLAAGLLDWLGILNIDFRAYKILIGLFLILGVLKVFYTLVESALGAKISISAFRKVNVISLITLASLFTAGLFFVDSVVDIAILMCVLWFSVAVIYAIAAKHMKTIEEE